MTLVAVNPYDLPLPDIAVEFLIYGDLEYTKKGAVGAAMSIAWHCGNSEITFDDTLTLLRDPSHAGGAWLRHQENEYPHKANRALKVLFGAWNGGREQLERSQS